MVILSRFACCLSRLSKKYHYFRSGTPALSRPAELFAQVNALRPQEFPNWEKFAETYCGSFRDRYGNASGSSNEAELKERLDGS